MIQDGTTISFIIDKVKMADMKLSEKTKRNLLKTKRTQDTNNPDMDMLSQHVFQKSGHENGGYMIKMSTIYFDMYALKWYLSKL